MLAVLQRIRVASKGLHLLRFGTKVEQTSIFIRHSSRSSWYMRNEREGKDKFSSEWFSTQTKERLGYKLRYRQRAL